MKIMIFILSLGLIFMVSMLIYPEYLYYIKGINVNDYIILKKKIKLLLIGLGVACSIIVGAMQYLED